MAEDYDIPTDELNDKIRELHDELSEEREEISETRKEANWTKAIALCTAVFAVLASLGALFAGGSENQALHAQLKASDTWSEYQASKIKQHLYEVSIEQLPANNSKIPLFQSQVDKEKEKGSKLTEQAKGFEKQSEDAMEVHHLYSFEVTFLQIAIALGAIAALTRIRWVFGGSVGVGLIGTALLIYAVIH